MNRSRKLGDVHVQGSVETWLTDVIMWEATAFAGSHDSWTAQITNHNHNLQNENLQFFSSELRKEAVKLEMIWAINLFKLV